jgi:hypothetical protein
MLTNFRVAIYQVVLEAGAEGLFLPHYKGSTLRGGFGLVFRRIACSMRQDECKGCLLKSNCPYAYIFETAPPPGAQALRNYENVPRPFVLEPPLENKTVYRPGETLTFGLVLFGQAIDYLPYFIVVLRELGETGIGKGRRKYRLKEIAAVDPLRELRETVYQEDEMLVHNVDLSVRGKDVPKLLDHYGQVDSIGGDLRAGGKALNDDTTPDRITVNFLTMTRIKYEDNFAGKIEFHMLIRSLLRRLSSLAYFHHGEELILDFTGLIERANEVKLIEDRMRWVDWERYSSRQEGKLNMGGVVGLAVYEGDLAEFVPLLRLGELVHVGKGAVFGMGKYELTILSF